VELGAAVTLALGLTWFVPDLSLPARGLTPRTLLTVSACVLPPAFLAGGAFPFFVRLGVRQLASLGKAFGTVSAVNTAGGIAGTLLAPFLFLPWLGLLGGLLACLSLNALLAAVFLFRSADLPRDRWARALPALGLVLVIALPALRATPQSPKRRVIHLDHGRQASVAVVRTAGRRELIVDGDPEAATGGDALETEELLGVLPLLLHPDPQRFLEVGLGSGITLGTAARFPLARIDCVEISASVIAAVRFFAPENRNVAGGGDGRIHIHHADGRAFLAARRGAYDVIVANTLHPWSVGATGLYSREYFGRVAGALRPGGIAVQWVPMSRIGTDHLAMLLRTFFGVFREGGIWWGAENLLLVGEGDRRAAGGPELQEETLSVRLRAAPEKVTKRLGLARTGEIIARRIATAQAVRDALGPGPILTDNRPALEGGGSRGSSAPGRWELLARIAREGAQADARAAPIHAWIRSRLARAQGYEEAANRQESRAERAGLELAQRRRLRRIERRGAAAFDQGRLAEAERNFRRVLAEAPADRGARFALGVIALKHGDLRTARRELERLTADHPGFAEGWNLLGAARRESGDPGGAREAFARALETDPFFPEAMANVGLAAAGVGNYATAHETLGRLRAISPSGPMPEEKALADALAGKH
jgi:spermidine synthase/tetratricopeptide (TPR) repeat protein